MAIRDTMCWGFQQIKLIMNSLFHPQESNSWFAQAMRQALSGAVTAILDLSFFKFFLWMNVSIFLSAIFSGCISTVENYLAGRWYVMSGVTQFSHGVRMQLGLHAVGFLGCLAITELVLLVLASWLGMWPVWAKICALPIGFCWSFMCNRYFIFKGSCK